MVSEITVTSIDETFPIAGKDNDSQGFRDNFSSIKTNFQTAKSEIDDLQANVVRTDQANNLNNNNILSANFVNCTEEVYDGNNVSGTVLVDFENGSYQRFRAEGSLTLRIVGFPDNNLASRVASMRIELTGDNYTKSIASVARNSGTVTIACTTNHGFTSGDKVTVTLTTNTSYNGTYIISVISATEFTYTLAGVNLVTTVDTGTCLVNRTVTFILGGGGVYKLASGTTNPVTVTSSSNPIIYEAWTYNSGNTVFLRSLGQFS